MLKRKKNIRSVNPCSTSSKTIEKNPFTESSVAEPPENIYGLDDISAKT